MMNHFYGTVRDGRVDTPLGSVATDLDDGTPAQVMIRPEGVILESNGKQLGTRVEVRSSHLLGHDNIVRVHLPGSQHKELYVRIHRTFEVELKKSLTARIDPEYAFVFAAPDLTAQGSHQSAESAMIKTGT